MSGFSDTQYAKCCWRRGSAYRRKGNIMCVSICRNLLTGLPVASKCCWRADATICVEKGKQEFSARTGVSCCAVSLCFTLSHYLLCSSALLSHRAFLCSFMVPVLVLFPSLVQEGCSCRILSMLCWERQCMGSTGGVGDFSSSQVWRLQFVRMCLSAFK